jgi:glutathione S-transferase
MRAKKVEFEVTFINLREKPDWFLELSPHGVVPVLKVGDDVLFESNAIAEFLDETVPPRLHPEDPIKRAKNRAWTDFVPTFAKSLMGVYYTESKEEVAAGIPDAAEDLESLENALKERGNDGPYFNGAKLSLVDCAYAPFLLRFTIMDRFLKTGLIERYPLVTAWRDALLANETVTGSLAPNFLEEFYANVRRQGYYVATLIDAETSEAAE